MSSQAETPSPSAQSPLKIGQEIGWLLLVLVIPLGVNLWGQQPFELPKVILLRTLVWLLVGLSLVEYLFTRRSLWRDCRTNPLLAPVVLLALVICVTTITAVNWRLSLWGSYERGQGAVTLLTYLLLFLLAASRLHTLPYARRLLTAVVAVAAPLILFSLGQALGWNPFGLVSDARSPVFATLGRANFLGAYLALLVPLTLALLVTSKRRYGRAGWAILCAGELIVIGLTLTRSAWLATAVGSLLFALLRWGSRLERRRRRLAWAGAGLLLLSGPLLVLWLGPRQLGSTAARLAIWQKTAELIGQRPLLGYGADALGAVFHRVYPPELVYFQGREFFVDRAHNLFLDWGVTAGLPGVLAYSLVLVTFVTVVARALQRPNPPQKQALLAGILAAVLAHTANNLVSFDVTPTAMVTWLLMGMGVALVAPPPRQTAVPTTTSSFRRWALAGLIGAGLATAVWQMNGRPLLADIAARAAQRQAVAGNWTPAAAAGEQAIAYWPVEPAYHLLLSHVYGQRAAAEPAVRTWLQRAETALQTAQQLRPEDPVVWLRTGRFYTAAARQLGAGSRDQANHAYRQALALAPNQATIYTAWGRAHLEANDPAAAAALLRQAVRLDASSGEAYIYLGAAELALGRLEVALADYREAARLLPGSSQAQVGLAQCYWQLDQPQAALRAVTAALQHDPHNGQALALKRMIQQRP